jgi:hypothetical protein
VKSAPVATASAVEKSSTDVDGVAVTGTNSVPGKASAINARVPTNEIRIPLAPPPSASRMPSTMDWRMRRRADAPSAARIAAWPRSARASSRLARLAQAISSKTADARNNTVSELENCRCISGTPPPAGVTTICWRRSWCRSSLVSDDWPPSHC